MLYSSIMPKTPVRPDRGPRTDLTGKRYGILTVMQWLGESRWLCKCDCGELKSVLTASLSNGNTKSCGCVRRRKNIERITKHGLTGTRAYRCWQQIIRRCYDPTNPSFKWYGARGITICDEWRHDFPAFLAHIGVPPSDEHTVDRIDTTKNYEPGNVRWVTMLEQSNNRTNNRWIIIRGERFTLAELIRELCAATGASEWQVRTALERIMPKREDINPPRGEPVA
jgi:hypothetical protein